MTILSACIRHARFDVVRLRWWGGAECCCEPSSRRNWNWLKRSGLSLKVYRLVAVAAGNFLFIEMSNYTTTIRRIAVTARRTTANNCFCSFQKRPRHLLQLLRPRRISLTRTSKRCWTNWDLEYIDTGVFSMLISCCFSSFLCNFIFSIRLSGREDWKSKAYVCQWYDHHISAYCTLSEFPHAARKFTFHISLWSMKLLIISCRSFSLH